MSRRTPQNLAYILCLAFACACGGTATDDTKSGANGSGGGGGSSGAGSCKLNSDCPGTMVCGENGLCKAECESSRDCPSGQRCVKTAEGDAGSSTPVCQLGTEAVCHYDTDCKDPLVCAVDLQCRNECVGDRDCTSGQRCVFGVCGEPSELNPDGTFKGATDAGVSSGFPGTPP